MSMTKKSRAFWFYPLGDRKGEGKREKFEGNTEQRHVEKGIGKTKQKKGNREKKIATKE